MKSLQENMLEYKKQLAKGIIQKAYLGLMEYMTSLRNHFTNQYPDYSVPGSIYYGYMDMTYFSILPKSLKNRDLKIAVVFLHGTCRFEIWLSGKNKQVLAKYWKIFQENNWDKYKIVAPAKGIDSIVEHILVNNPDFGNLDGLTNQIDKGTLKFIQDIESFLSQAAAEHRA
ncbi:MAG: hypothetical protein NT121_02805 [Chloroflexi bacterium]|nr:hypothetical protein [Chloroflexota bacterium]